MKTSNTYYLTGNISWVSQMEATLLNFLQHIDVLRIVNVPFLAGFAMSAFQCSIASSLAMVALLALRSDTPPAGKEVKAVKGTKEVTAYASSRVGPRFASPSP